MKIALKKKKKLVGGNYHCVISQVGRWEDRSGRVEIRSERKRLPCAYKSKEKD